MSPESAGNPQHVMYDVPEASQEYTQSPTMQNYTATDIPPEAFYNPNYGMNQGPLFEQDYDSQMESKINSYLKKDKPKNTPVINEKSRVLAN